MQLAVSRVNSLRAFSWIKSGWRLFTQQPAPFMAIAGILMAIQLLASLVPLASYVAVFLLPFLTIGLYQVASKVEQGEQVSVNDLFHYLSRIREYRVLFRISLVSILLSIPASMAGSNMAEAMIGGLPPALDQLVIFVLFMGLNFMATAFSIPAAWVNPNSSVKVLIYQSFQAGWQNVVPMTIYGIVIMAIWMVSMPVILIGWLIALSLSNLSFYHAFLDIYQPVNNAESNSQAQSTGEQSSDAEIPAVADAQETNTETTENRRTERELTDEETLKNAAADRKLSSSDEVERVSTDDTQSERAQSEKTATEDSEVQVKDETSSQETDVKDIKSSDELDKK
ncbi:hypothetical protein Q4575_17535 [Psychrosphaera sp. 1_MG-2023]|uniref:hypothetical protein n=1 Tax=Psychrosphaera sp. 1_MG-2023 TaxID=3062643 RepID=UPI0026E1A591|nr:hypothetical protein [Psychrosphaera sp. 1_MG-2023]MDO6721218.1 hypothetical protein [Psychrosphaera sp. 1_MG-2023]